MMIFAFSLLGGVIGIFVGTSMTSVIGTVLPALLTFLTALLAYLFGLERLAEWRPVIPLCIIVLLMTCLYGTFVGTSVKAEHVKSEREYKEKLLYYEKVYLEIREG